tara:strand:+ start:716 stop:1135 length:420 start_codon:yes stop_codon:yes gene_type:complete
MTALATIAESLATHKETLVRNYEQAKKELEDFNKSLESRYSDTAKELLKQEGKDFGTATLVENNHKIKIEMRKKIDWDQNSLRDYLETLPPEEASHYAKVSITVPESKFTNAVPEVQNKLKEFRTVSLQGVKVTFEEIE